MAHKVSRLGILHQLEKKQRWFFLKTTKKCNSINYEYSIIHNIYSLFTLFIQLPKKNIKTKRKTKEEKFFRIPLIFGHTYIGITSQQIFCSFNYFYDFSKVLKSNRYCLYFRICRALLGISKLFTSLLSISLNNLYLIFKDFFDISEFQTPLKKKNEDDYFFLKKKKK